MQIRKSGGQENKVINVTVDSNLCQITWNRLNSNYFDTVVYVNHLLATVTISEKCKSTLVAFFRSSGQVTLSYSTHSVVVKSALDDILMGMIPTGVL